MAESTITPPETLHVTTMANHTTENVTEASDWPLVGDDLHPAARAVFVTIGTGMVISGVGGNLLLLTVLFKQFVRKRSVHHLFIGNLALADLLTLGYWFVFFVLDLILGYHPVANDTHCRANGLVVGTMFIVSISFLTSVTFNRYLHVCHTRLYQRLFTLRRTVVICVVIWVVGHLLALPPEFKSVAGSYQYSKEGHICSFNREGFTYPKAIVVLFSTLPMFFIGYCNWAIFRFWRAARLSLTGRYPQLGPGAASVPAAPASSKRNEESKANSKRGCPTWGCLRKWRHAVEGKGVADSTGRSHAAGKVDLDVLKFQVEDKTHEDDAGDDNSEDDAEVVDEEEEDAVDEEEEDDAEEDEDEDTQCYSPEESTVLSSGIGTTDDASVLCSDPSTSTLATESKGTGEEKSSMTTMARIRALTSRQKKPSAKKCISGRKTSSRRSHMRSIAKKRLRKKRAQEVALVRTLMVVFILVFSFFIPYFLIILVGSIVKLPTEVTILGIIFLFFNNSVNWIVYGVMNPTFRQGYVQCLRAVAARLFFCSRKNNCCPCRAAGNLNVSYVSSSSGVGITPSSQTAKTSKIEPHDSSEIASV